MTSASGIDFNFYNLRSKIEDSLHKIIKETLIPLCNYLNNFTLLKPPCTSLKL